MISFLINYIFTFITKTRNLSQVKYVYSFLFFIFFSNTVNAHFVDKTFNFTIDVNLQANVCQVGNLFSIQDSVIYKIRKVVIDAGHGGKDSGCIGYSHKQEKDITLKIALLIGKKIKKAYPNIQVIYTRDSDVFIPLDERANIANKNKADVFISIHCNFLPGHSKYHGAETYVLGLHKTKENLEVARRENAAVILEDNYQKKYNGYQWDSPEANILITAWQSSYLDRSIRLANGVQKNLANGAERKNLGVKQAGFLVLRATTMPSILIETGFLSNPEEERYLSSAEGQNEEATAIFNAFESYKNNVEGGHYIAPPSEPIREEVVEIEQENQEKKPQVNIPPSPKKASEFTSKGGATVQRKEVKLDAPQKTKNTIQFKVQLATSPYKIINKNDKKWNQIENVEIRFEDKQYKYLAFGFSTYEDALKAAKDYNDLGFTGAFVVAYEGETRVDIKKYKK